jgi:signal transduction histidine kinase
VQLPQDADQEIGPAESRRSSGDRVEVIRAPLVHRGRTLGSLMVEVPPGRVFSPADRRLLDDLTGHAAVVVDAVHLTLDLQRSRARIVGAREEERRRLRRDLHDGVGPSLAAMVLKLNVLGATVDNPSSRELLDGLRGETKDAIAEIRRLVDDLRPPALDEVGLVGALRQRAATLSDAGGSRPMTIEVQGPGSTVPLPAAAEVAAYRIAVEAMTNVVRHAGATRCIVTLTINGGLELCVNDNGHGPRPDAVPGVGWTSMRERAAELGGSCSVTTRPEAGTTVRAVLPLPRLVHPAPGVAVAVVPEPTVAS